MTHIVALVLYIGALTFWLRTFAGGSRPPGYVAAVLATGGVAVHATALAGYFATYGEPPLVGLGPSLSTLSFIVGLGLVATVTLGEGARVGILLIPLIVLLESAALALGIRPAPASLDFRGAWFALHVTLAFAAIGGMALSASAGALYLTQHRELKQKRMGRVFRFVPPLPILARIGSIAATSSLVLLTLGLALGWAWTVTFRGTLAGSDPKTLWGIFIWVAILWSVVARRGASGTERRGAVASLTAFALIVTSYLLLRMAVGGGLFL